VLTFFETAVFTRQITELLDDRDYAALQGALVVSPAAGDVIRGTGGIRKLRWSQPARGKGKRGGVRVIYYLQAADDAIYLLLAYSKDERDDLTAEQKRTLTKLVKEEFG
jgi:hypothetical protein